MVENQKKQNMFEKMEQEKTNKPEKPRESEKPQNNELSLEDFSNTAVGDKIKYNRPNLDGKKDVIDKFQVFMPDIDKDEPQLSRDRNTEYWTATCILTYESTNEDGLQNREYISGIKVFKQRDGRPSEPNFYYTSSRTQIAYLWEKVAMSKNVEPEELSPREFIAFMNNKPKVIIESKEYDNYTTERGAPKFVYKNMPKEFI